MKRIIFVVLFLAVGCLWLSGQAIFAQEEASRDGVTARCSTNADCNRPGMIGVCQSPGEKTARCVWQEIVKVPAIVIEPQECRSCRTTDVVNQLRMFFPGLDVTYLKASDPKAKDLITQIKITVLPAYIISKDAERESSFADFQKMATLANGQYYIKPEFSGVSFFLNRKVEKNKLDLFIVLTSPGMYHPVKIAEEIKKNKKEEILLQIHFLGIEDGKTKQILSPGNDREPDEEKVYACVEKYYPQQASDYLINRLMTASNLWIEDDLQKYKFDLKKIKNCAQGAEGEKLLREKIRLSQELELHYAPLFLMENTEVFGVSDETTADEIINMINPRKRK